MPGLEEPWRKSLKLPQKDRRHEEDHPWSQELHL